VYRITNPGNRFFTLTNAVDAERRYDGLQLIARQVSSRLQWQVSYTAARARGTASNRYHSNAVLNDHGNPGRVAWFCEESACEIVRAEKVGTRRLPSLHLLDLRVEKQARVRGFVSGVFAEILNAGNLGRYHSSKGFAVIEQSGFYFRAPNHWTTPRTARAGVRLTF
jgi:hypothetical protein